MHVPPHMTCMYPPPHMTWQVLNKFGEVNLAVINASIPSSYDMVCMYPPPRMKWQVLNKFGEVNLAEINSKGGFFMGIIKRFREQERGVFAGTNCLLIVSYEEEDTCMSHKQEDRWIHAIFAGAICFSSVCALATRGMHQHREEEDTCMSHKEEDTCN